MSELFLFYAGETKRRPLKNERAFMVFTDSRCLSGTW